MSRSGVVAVGAHGNGWVWVCSVGGEWKRKIESAALPSPLGACYGAAFDAQERVVTCDWTGTAFVRIEPR